MGIFTMDELVLVWGKWNDWITWSGLGHVTLFKCRSVVCVKGEGDLDTCFIS